MSAEAKPSSIAHQLDTVRQRILGACDKFQRSPNDIHLLAVSKTKPVSMVAEAMEAGQVHFGENYLQDAMEKVETLGEGPVWHFIGAIQSNKTRLIAENFDWVHTVTSLKIARRLNNQRPESKTKLKIFLQVNIDQDPAKSGIDPATLGDIVQEFGQFQRLQLMGLMTLPTQRDSIDEQRVPFRALNDLQQQHLHTARDLSMGMSGDLEAAIAEGSTWVRIGTDIFGSREQL